MSWQENPNSLAARVAAAMRRRVGVGRAMTVKQLAYAVQVSEGTVCNLLAGNNAPSGETLLRLIQFFDASFANEIMGPRGCVVAKLSDARAADAIRRLNEARDDLIAATGGKR